MNDTADKYTLIPIEQVVQTETAAEWAPPVMRDLLCPICGTNYQHWHTPRLSKSNDDYGADWQGRGSLIIIPIDGECGHTWQICLGFHKGNTALFARYAPQQLETNMLVEFGFDEAR